MKKYKIYYGYNNYYISNSRNVAKHLQDTGSNKITIFDMNGNFIIAGVKFYDGKIGYFHQY